VEPAALAAHAEAGRPAGAVGTRDHDRALGAVDERVHPQLDALGPGGDRVLVVGRQWDDGVRAGQQWQSVDVVLLAHIRSAPARTSATSAAKRGVQPGRISQ
jgi:hypothetical protein